MPPASLVPLLRAAAIGTCLGASVVVVHAGQGDAIATAEPHLSIIPRAAAEAARVEQVTTPATDFSAPEKFEARPAGAATSLKRVNHDAFSHASANMPFEREMDFKVGNGLFRKVWVAAPSSTEASDGLGPLYNARSCQRCHIKDGRGHPYEGQDDNAVSMFLRVSVPGGAPGPIPGSHRVQPDPVYGEQLQDFSIPGVPAEYRLDVSWEEIEVALSGGETAWLRRPTWRAEQLGYGPLAEGAMLSPRVAPQMIGLGLLEAVPAADILALADPEDADRDGISGRPNIAWSREFDRPMLGRFGLKAGAPTIRQQSAAAFSGDMGLSTSLFPAGAGECTDVQPECQAAPDGGSPLEVDDVALDLVTFYSRNLAVPARRDVDDPRVLRGKQVFHDAGCAACHTPKFVTHRLADRPEQSFQLIWPYTDMLLHDMGEGLADNRPEGLADSQEWRTAPLWGIGLTQTVSGHSKFLHDGRARNLLEAVLWHGGEAEASRAQVVEMPPADRAALLTFLGSL
ncbi:c-type cytochrome [Limibaculum sp. M0105]|uniref:C-type cytochrome n=1 Tax=Thermohalobaculum xanthum TaxID=2753746 RepID=A0A8J7M4Y8_9RHOB|nr:c-type cytochrome [Thermohalobaculum xanthum]